MPEPIQVTLPVLHPDQVAAFRLPGQYKAIRCGRRWGKTDYAKTIACDAAVKGRNIGWFAPDYKISSEAFNEIATILEPVKQTSSKVEGVIRTITGGRIDFWTLDNERAGRSRKYHLVIIDEAAFTKPNMVDIWEKSILPTLLDYGGRALVLSNTNGVDPENFFWRICNQPKWGFVEHHAPTVKNPYIPEHLPGEDDETYEARRAAVFAKLKADNSPLVYRQEFLAEFVDFSGEAFFELSKLLDNGSPVDCHVPCDAVFAVMDTATKTGTDADGTGVVYCGLVKHPEPRLVILDYDLIQIEGALLETWLPNVFRQCDAFAEKLRARSGSLGAFIEDKSSGMILLQQAKRRGWSAHEIDSKLTAVGKDERAISISGYVYQGKVKLSRTAYDKALLYKGQTKNHLVSQITGFRVGDKDAAKRSDDLLDCFCYSTAIALGNSKGF